MLLVDDLAAGGTKNLRHTPRGLVTLPLATTIYDGSKQFELEQQSIVHHRKYPLFYLWHLSLEMLPNTLCIMSPMHMQNLKLLHLTVKEVIHNLLEAIIEHS